MHRKQRDALVRIVHQNSHFTAQQAYLISTKGVLPGTKHFSGGKATHVGSYAATAATDASCLLEGTHTHVGSLPVE